jgi:hypothetical protein
VFDRLFSLTPEIGEDGDERPRLVTLGDGGKRVWVAFYNEHATEQVELSGDEAAAWSKLEGYAARLALVVHLTRWAAGDATLHDPSRVDEASVKAGVILARWFGHEARRVYAILSESDDDREARRLVELIRRMGGDVSGRELVQRSRMFRTVADAEAALSGLVEVGAGSWVTPEQRGRGGPKARRFVLSPVYGVNVYRNAPGGTENANSVDVDGVDAGAGTDATLEPRVWADSCPLAVVPPGADAAPPPAVPLPRGLEGPPAPAWRCCDPNDAPAGNRLRGRFRPDSGPGFDCWADGTPILEAPPPGP